MTQTSRLVIQIDSAAAQRNVQIITREMQRMTAAGSTVINSTVTINNNLRNTERQMTATSNAARSLIGQLGVMAIAYKAISASDDFVGLKNRLVLVTNSQQELNAAMSATFDIAQRTGASWDNAAGIYQGFARSAKELGLNQQRLVGITETVSKAVALSGGSATSASAALVQFNQALASGVLRGEEFNSVMEQAPGLAQALAKGLGVPVGQLRALAQEGKITAAAMVSALEKVAPEVAKSFDKTTFTISQNFTKLQNSIVKFVGESNGGSAVALSAGINELAKNLDLIANTGAAVAVGYITKALIAGTAATTASTLASVDRISALVAERNANIAAAQAETVAAQAELRATEINLANANSTRVQVLAEIELEKTRLRSQITDQGRMATMTRMAQLGQIQAQVVLEIAAAETAQAATSARVTTALAAQAAATSRLSIVKAGLMAVMSPMGLTIAATAAAFYFLTRSANEVKESLATQSGSVEELANKYKELNAVQGLVEGRRLRGEITAAKQAMDDSKATIERYIYWQKEIFKVDGRDYSNYRKAIDSIRTGAEDAAVVVKRMANSGSYSQDQIDKLIEYSGAIAESKKNIQDNSQASVLLGQITKDLTDTVVISEAALMAEAQSLNLLTRAYGTQKEALVSQLQIQLEIAKANGATEQTTNKLIKVTDDYTAKKISASAAAKEFIAAGYVPENVRASLVDQASKVDASKAAMVAAKATIDQLTGAQDAAAIAAKKHADELGGVATNADTARKAIEKYINQQRESIKRDAFQYTLETKFNYDPARAKAYADAYGATGANGKLDPAAKQYAEQSYQQQKKLGDLADARREAEKKSRKEESDAEKERKRLFKERQNDYKNYAESLTDESVIIDKEYSRQVDLIKAFAVGDEKARLLQRSLAVAQEKQAELGIQNARFYNSFFENENSKADLIRTHYAQEKELIFNNAKLSKAEREDIFNALTRQQDRELAALDRQQQQELLSQRQVYMTATGYAMERYRLERQEIQQNLQLSEEYRKKLLEVNQANMFAARDQAGAAVGNIQQRFNEALMQRDNPREFAQYQLQNQYEGDSGALAGAYQNNQDGINAKNDDGQYLLDEQTRNQRLLDAHQQFLSAKATMDEEYNRQQQDLLDSQQAANLAAYSNIFGDLSGLAKSFGGEQSNTYRLLFAAQKGFALSSALVNNWKTISDAYANEPGTIWNKIAAGAVAASQTGVFSAAISAITPKGFSAGGYTGSGGKYDPAGLVHKGEVVWSQDDIKRWGGVNAVESMRTSSRVDGAIAQSRSGVSSSTPKVTINNYGNDRVNVSDDGSGGITIDIVRQEIAKGAPAAVANDLASSPNSTTSKAMSRHYQVQRNR